jgi:hypothetical protein
MPGADVVAGIHATAKFVTGRPEGGVEIGFLAWQSAMPVNQVPPTLLSLADEVTT